MSSTQREKASIKEGGRPAEEKANQSWVIRIKRRSVYYVQQQQKGNHQSFNRISKEVQKQSNTSVAFFLQHGSINIQHRKLYKSHLS